jgi:hypothetical protein
MKLLFILLVLISFNGFSQSVKMNICYNIEFMKTDLGGEMTLDEAKKACEKLGDEWRLPTLEELKFMYDKKNEIGGFQDWFYWSSTGIDGNSAWSFSFLDGIPTNSPIDFPVYVRAVRTRAVRTFK